jgi:hydrogenase maturation factor HypF (carbamoyltransferase family)
MSKKHIVIDPVTRIEGHLRIEAVIDENNTVVDAYSSSTMFRGIETILQGRDRLIANIEKSRPELFAVLQEIEDQNMSLFDALSAIIGLEGRGFEAVADTALQFMGKGGTQIDTKLGDTRFNPYVFIASIISYKMADVGPVMLSYSLFESLGDYFVDILTQLQSKAKAEHLVLCGAQIAQSSLYSRIMQKMKGQPPLVNRSFPIGREGAVIGGIYL